MTDISKIISDVNNGQVIIDLRYSSEINRNGTQDSIKFENICFDDFFDWGDVGNETLKIGSHEILSILVQKLSTQNTTLNIQHIKQIKFKNCKFNYLPTIINRGIWKIEFDSCTFDGSGEDWIPKIFEPTRSLSDNPPKTYPKCLKSF